MKITLFLLFFVVPLSAFAQSSFRVSDTLLQIDKNNNYTFTYAPVDVYNETEDTLRLGWEFLEKEGFPAAWNFALQEPENYYREDIPPTANFLLDTAYDYTDKFIPQIFMNGVAGEGSMTFKIYDLQNPNDSVRIRFEVEVREVLALKENAKARGQVSVYPLPSQRGKTLFVKSKNRMLEGNAHLFSLAGKHIADLKIINGQVTLPTALKQGTYVLCVEQANAKITKHPILIY
jgi:hypothetical protein